MGAAGSGRFSERSLAWDFKELAVELAERLERARFDATVLNDLRWLEERKARVQILSERLRFLAMKGRMEKER